MKGRGLAAFAAAAVRFPTGTVFPVSPGFILVDQQVLETARHVAKFAVDQMDVAGEAGRGRLIAGEFANEAVILSQDVLQASAKVPKLRQLLRHCDRLVSVSFAR